MTAPTDPIEVRAWSNGSPLRTGAGYGVRLSGHDRDKHFDPAWREVIVDLDGGESISVSLSESFWGSCPELRNAAIGRWLLRHGHAPWSRGARPAALLISAGSNRFRLRPLLDPIQAASAGTRPCGNRTYLPSWCE